MIDELDSYDEICSFFSEAWNVIDWSLVGNVQPPTIYYTGRTSDTPPAEESFVRLTINPTIGEQSTLSGGVERQKLWNNQGVISVQCFGSLQLPNAFEVAKYAAIMAKRVFQGKTTENGIWFRNCRATEIGQSDGWFQYNTIVEYQFDELR